MPSDQIADNYAAGGYALSQDGAGSPSSGIGRWWNNISGTTANNMFSAQEAEKARAFNSAEAQKQRDFEEYMSNTAYQRGVQDMKASGINPMVAAGAAQASTPQGTSATSPAAHAAGSGNGGVLSLISKAANIAIAKGLEAKFTNSAERAADNHELVTAKVRHLAAMERENTARMAFERVKEGNRTQRHLDKMEVDLAKHEDQVRLRREEDAAKLRGAWQNRFKWY